MNADVLRLRRQIEELRRELIKLTESMSFTAMDVVAKSQKLDRVLTDYERKINNK